MSTSEFGDVAKLTEKRDDKVGFMACMLPYTTVIARSGYFIHAYFNQSAEFLLRRRRRAVLGADNMAVKASPDRKFAQTGCGLRSRSLKYGMTDGMSRAGSLTPKIALTPRQSVQSRESIRPRPGQ
jgi:hypothetical protein